MPKFNVRRAVVSAGLAGALAFSGTAVAFATETQLGGGIDSSDAALQAASGEEQSKAQLNITYRDPMGDYVWSQTTPADNWFFSLTGIVSHEGLTFAGWSLDAQGGEILDPSQALTLTGDVTLYAQWAKAEQPQGKLNVFYRDSLDDKYSWIWSGAPADGWFFNPQASGAIEHEGYTFAGWSYDKEGKQPAAQDDLLTTTGDVTVYAQWAKAEQPQGKLNVFYRDSMDEDYLWTWTGAPADGWYFDPSANGAMVHNGYEFAGWTYDKEGKQPVAQDDLLTTTGDVTVYAQWTKAEESSHLNILYRDSLDGSYLWTWTGAPADGWFFDPQANGAIEHEGYKFVGWSLDKQGGEILDPAQALTLVGDVQLYAQWEKVEESSHLNILYRDSLNDDYLWTWVGAPADGWFFDPQANGAIEHEGYKFVGWSLDKQGGEILDPAQALTLVGDVQLYAQWEKVETPAAKEYTVSFQTGTDTLIEDVKVKEGETVAEPTAKLEKDGYTFDCWTLNGEKYDFSTPVTSNITLVAEWTKNETPVDPDTTYYTVTFVNGDGTTVATQKVAEGKTASKIADPTRDGWTFAGWVLDGMPFDFNMPVTSDITVTATWKAVDGGKDDSGKDDSSSSDKNDSSSSDKDNGSTSDKDDSASSDKDNGATSDKDNGKKDDSQKKDQLPKTGDDTNVAGLAAAGAAGVAALGAGAVLLNRRKREQN